MNPVRVSCTAPCNWDWDEQRASERRDAQRTRHVRGTMMSRKLRDEGHMRAMSKFKGQRMDRSESERDSGFSDASSEHLSAVGQTDTDDTLCSVGSAGVGPGSQPSQLAAVVGGGALQGLSPMIIMNNVVLKQSGDNPSSLKPWSFSPAVEVVQQPQVVFLQPMVPQRTAAVSKGPSSKRRRHKKYLPILKSYPKIAPHPGDNPQKGGSSSSSSSSSSSGSSVKSLSSSQLDCSQKEHQHSSQPSVSSITPTATSSPNPPPAASILPHNTPANLNGNGSLHSARQASTRPESTDGRPDPPPQTLTATSRDISTGTTDNKLKRFCNTYNILSKSGLLDITLRTKELIRQNRRTQTELERLREHTNLFVKALQTGDSEIWSKLQMSMQTEAEQNIMITHK